MKCNPLRWLWGLVPLALVFAIAVLGEQESIEADLKARADNALAAAGYSWAQTSFDGRDAVVSGRAVEGDEQRAAVQEVAGLWGVRIVENQSELIDLVSTYTWSAALQGGRLRLSGHVPNETTRRAIVGAAKATFPGRDINDQMQLARGAPDQNRWIGGVSFGLKQLARLKTGGRVELDNTGLTVEGEAEDIAGYKSLKTSLANDLPQGVRLKADKVGPATIKPYTWSAIYRGQQLELSGYVPSERQRDEIFNAAKQAFPKAAVVDRMSIAGGEPRGWHAVVASALSKLGQLDEGVIELRDAQVTMSGLAQREQTVDAVRKSLRADIPSGFKFSDQLKFKEAAVRSPAPAAGPSPEELAAQEAERKARADADARAKAADAKRRAAAEDAERIRAEVEAKARAASEARRKQDAEADAARLKLERERAAEAAKCQQAVSEVTSKGMINFAWASADIDRRSTSILDGVAKAVATCPRLRIEISGHTDAEGTPERKQRLSERRAGAVLDYLAKAGVGTDRMRAVGYADSQPVAPNDTADNRAKNRRIVILVKAN